MAGISDSLLEEMEPRILRPILPLINDRDIAMQAQVSEPSLYTDTSNVLSPFKEVFGPRSNIRPASPIKNLIFSPAIATPRRPHNFREESNTPCRCKSSGGLSSPSVDPEIKELIQDQNKQLQMLRKQVEQLLNYQEKLGGQSNGKKCHESTQTSFLELSPMSAPRQDQTPPKKPACAASSRFSTQERTEFTLTFRDLQLETIVEQPPSPQPSIVVQMQDYPESILERADNDSVSDSCSTVMEHVQRLLAQANFTETRKVLNEKSYDNVQNQENCSSAVRQSVEISKPVRKVTMQRVQEYGISFVAPAQNFNSYPQNYSSNVGHWESRKETDQSVEMKLLAEKYLGKRNNFLSKIEQPPNNRRPVEMSMSTKQYLERYGLANNSVFQE